jgi:hypothetical protein
MARTRQTAQRCCRVMARALKAFPRSAAGAEAALGAPLPQMQGLPESKSTRLHKMPAEKGDFASHSREFACGCRGLWSGRNGLNEHSTCKQRL